MATLKISFIKQKKKHPFTHTYTQTHTRWEIRGDFVYKRSSKFVFDVIYNFFWVLFLKYSLWLSKNSFCRKNDVLSWYQQPFCKIFNFHKSGVLPQFELNFAKFWFFGWSSFVLIIFMNLNDLYHNYLSQQTAIWLLVCRQSHPAIFFSGWLCLFWLTKGSDHPQLHEKCRKCVYLNILGYCITF